MVLEIERKFLLNSIPNIPPDYILNITQFYFQNLDGVWERIRKQFGKDGYLYFHTIKTYVEKSTNIENEKKISEEEYNLLLLKNPLSKSISKNRHVYKYGELKWEVDFFPSNGLVLAEIEIPTKDWKLEIPNFISDKIIREVTGELDFSNRYMMN